MTMTTPEVVPNEDIDTEAFLGWLEFSCWTVLALAPMLYFVNGPPVSRDQLVVQIGLVILSAATASGLLFRRTRIARSLCNMPCDDDGSSP